MSRTRAERIAPTAHYTAYAWYRLGFPHADCFVTPQGRRLFWSLWAGGQWLSAYTRHVPNMLGYLEYRHRAIERCVTSSRADRLVELGAGLSRRGVTAAADWAIEAHEFDLPHMIAAKRALLANAPASVRRSTDERLHLRALDVTSTEFVAALIDALRGAARPVVVAEGLVSYLPLQQRDLLFHAIARALKQVGGGAFVCDLHTAKDRRRVGVAMGLLELGIRLVTRSRAKREPFASGEQVYACFGAAGFDEVTRLEPADDPHRSPAWIVRASVRPSLGR